VLRGGSWGDDDPRLLRSSVRGNQNPTMQLNVNGFRCAADVPEKGATTDALGAGGTDSKNSSEPDTIIIEIDNTKEQ
jgi:hypothetical protein